MKLIGITSYNTISNDGFQTSAVDSNYVNLVLKMGYIPVIIPTMDESIDFDGLIKRLDGIIFTGGEDITPHIIGEHWSMEITPTDYIRDLVEFELLKLAQIYRKPIFGICRGLQLYCARIGRKPRNLNKHEHEFPLTNQNNRHHFIKLKSEGILSDLFGPSKIQVNSYHHQGVIVLPMELELKEYGLNGDTLEILYDEKTNFLGVQWHPEILINSRETDCLISLYKSMVDKNSL